MQAAVEQVIRSRSEGRDTRRSLLAAISGIDGSGKSTIARQVARDLEARGQRVALIPLDPWHTPPAVRFGGRRSPEHFYFHAFRMEELFELLVEPLRRRRSRRLTVDLIHQPGDVPYEHTYDFEEVDVILLEGIFLLRRELRPLYDLAVWLDCPFEVALRRAIARNQENLSEAEIVRDYTKLYFPAQRLHLERDNPSGRADLVLVTHP
jgi:uridine kinase